MPSLVPKIPVIAMISESSELDLDVDASRKVKPHQRVDRLRRRIDDVDQPLVRPHLEVLARVLVLVRRADDAVHVLFGRQRHGTGDTRAGTGHRVDDLARRTVDDLVVICLEPDADLLSRHCGLSSSDSLRAAVFQLREPAPPRGAQAPQPGVPGVSPWASSVRRPGPIMARSPHTPTSGSW